MADEQPEPSDGGDYPTDNLEREAQGLPPLLESYRTPNPPQLVRAAFVVLCVAAVLVVVGFVLMLKNGEHIVEQLMDAYTKARNAGDSTTARTGVTETDVQEGVPGLLAMLTFGGAVIAALLVLFGYKAREGSRSARTRAAAMVVVIAVFVVGMPSSFVNVGLIAALVAGAVGIVMLHLPSVAGYFPRPPSAARRWRG